MSFEAELRRYLEQGIDLQHRRLERIRYLTTGEPYQNLPYDPPRRFGNAGIENAKATL
mgnify:CR=1 FL=1